MVKEFKFFQKEKVPPQNLYLGFDMDEVLINVIRYRHHYNMEILNDSDTLVANVGVPIDNCWLRILTFRTLTNMRPEMLEIRYRVFETNNNPLNFTARIRTVDFLTRMEQ
jgi:hypothetical protein